MDLRYVDGLAALVPAAAATNRVRNLGGLATGAIATSRSTELPVARTGHTDLGLGLLLLWDGHDSLAFR
jgi:hypothetical protein